MTTSWFRVGTISTTNNQTTVTGKDTKWLSHLSPIVAGDMLTLDFHHFYEVVDVTSDTELTLDRVFSEATAANKTYAIIRNGSSTFSARTAAAVQKSLSWYENNFSQLDKLVTEDFQIIVDNLDTIIDAGVYIPQMADQLAKIKEVEKQTKQHKIAAELAQTATELVQTEVEASLLVADEKIELVSGQVVAVEKQVVAVEVALEQVKATVADSNGILAEVVTISDQAISDMNSIYDSLSATTNIYKNVAEGIAATTNGELFLVVSDKESGFSDLYLNDKGTGVYQDKTTIEANAISNIMESVPVIVSKQDSLDKALTFSSGNTNNSLPLPVDMATIPNGFNDVLGWFHQAVPKIITTKSEDLLNLGFTQVASFLDNTPSRRPCWLGFTPADSLSKLVDYSGMYYMHEVYIYDSSAKFDFDSHLTMYELHNGVYVAAYGEKTFIQITEHVRKYTVKHRFPIKDPNATEIISYGVMIGALFTSVVNETMEFCGYTCAFSDQPFPADTVIRSIYNKQFTTQEQHAELANDVVTIDNRVADIDNRVVVLENNPDGDGPSGDFVTKVTFNTFEAAVTSDVTKLTQRVDALNVGDGGLVTAHNKLKGRKWAFLGDSITVAANSYARIISARNEMIAWDEGCLSGATMGESNRGMHMYLVYKTIPEDVDYITVACGTNDEGLPAGVMSDRTASTFYGACHIVFEGILTKYPHAKLGVIGILQRGGSSSLMRYRDRNDRIKEVAEYYGLPFLDINRDCNGLTANIPSVLTRLMPDKLHPNDLGHEVYASKVEPWLLTI